MELSAKDVLIKLFEPDDGSESSAIKLLHKTSRTEVVNDDTPSQRENLRRAARQMLTLMNPNPGRIEESRYILFDSVKLHMPESIHSGEITGQTWDFKRSQWSYFIDCHNPHVDAWYNEADIDLDEPVEFDEQ